MYTTAWEVDSYSILALYVIQVRRNVNPTIAATIIIRRFGCVLIISALFPDTMKVSTILWLIIGVIKYMVWQMTDNSKAVMYRPR